MVRRAIHLSGVATLILAWLAGARCFCNPPVARAATPHRAAACPLCAPATAGDSHTAPPVTGWCPKLAPAVPDRAVVSVDPPALLATLPPPSDGWATAIRVVPTTPLHRPPPRSLFDLHCSLLG